MMSGLVVCQWEIFASGIVIGIVIGHACAILSVSRKPDDGSKACR